jgi:hypothetical protein
VASRKAWLMNVVYRLLEPNAEIEELPVAIQ